MVQLLKWGSLCAICGAPGVTGGCGEARRAFCELGKSMESLPRTTDARETTHVESQLPSQSMALGSSADSGGWKETYGIIKTVWISKPSVSESGLELSNVTIANATQRPANALSLVKFVCQRAANGCLSIF